jgi:glyoxylase-like metal-dependent hydrolase (beta-lactamase superfamily II)
VPVADVHVELSILAAGFCRQLHSAVFPREGWRVVPFRALFALLRHPTEGIVLIDTGYAEPFFTATRRYPYRLYALALPVVLPTGESAVDQLRARGIAPEDVRTIVISHFHADHIAGLRDFPEATFVSSRRAYDAVRELTGVAATRRAFVPELLPDDFEARARLLGPEDEFVLGPDEAPFERGVDLFGDGSVVTLDLDGHASGQLGLLIRTETGRTLMAADAVWHSRALREGVYPAPLSRLLVPSWAAFRASFERLKAFQQRHPEVRIVPSHCDEIYREAVAGARAV